MIRTSTRWPAHPGPVLKEETLNPAALSLNHLAKELKVPANRLSQIVNGRRAISPDTSILHTRYEFELVRRQFGTRIEAEVTLRQAA